MSFCAYYPRAEGPPADGEFIASNSGWLAWTNSVMARGAQFPAAAHLACFGWSDQWDDLGHELEGVIHAAADPDMAAVTAQVLAAVRARPAGAAALLVSDGEPGGEEETSESVFRESGPPGPPPRPNLVWNDTTHRWRNPETGEEHEHSTGAGGTARVSIPGHDAARARLPAAVPGRPKTKKDRDTLARGVQNAWTEARNALVAKYGTRDINDKMSEEERAAEYALFSALRPLASGNEYDGTQDLGPISDQRYAGYYTGALAALDTLRAHAARPAGATGEEHEHSTATAEPQPKAPYEMTRAEFQAAHPVRRGDMADYVKAWLAPHKKGKPGIKFVEDAPGVGQAVMRDETGKVVAVVAYEPNGVAHLITAPGARGQGHISKLLDAVAEKTGITNIKGPYTPEGAAVAHRRAVKLALAVGKPVPAEVLKDYPDLAAKYGKPAAESVFTCEPASLRQAAVLAEDHGEPPWPGAVFDDTAHRWKNPHTGEEAPEAHPAAAKAKSLAARIKEVPAALVAKVGAWVKAKHDKLAARYGSKGAKAILAAMILLAPTPVPGSSLIPIALAEAALRVVRAVSGAGRGAAPPAAEAIERELSAEEVEQIARGLLAELERDMKEAA